MLDRTRLNLLKSKNTNILILDGVVTNTNTNPSSGLQIIPETQTNTVTNSSYTNINTEIDMSNTEINTKKPLLEISPLNKLKNTKQVHNQNIQFGSHVDSNQVDNPKPLISFAPVEGNSFSEFKFNLRQKHAIKDFNDNDSGELDTRSYQKYSSDDDQDYFVKDYFASETKVSPTLKRINLGELSEQISDRSFAKNIKSKNRTVRYVITAVFCSLLLSLTIASFVSYNNNSDKNAEASSEVLGVEETKINENYSIWIKSFNKGNYSEPEKDIDSDKLTNFEEFIIGSNPSSAHSCNPNIEDEQNLINLIDPSTCKGIDLNNIEDTKKFSEIINIPQTQIETNPNQPPIIETRSLKKNITKNESDINFVLLSQTSSLSTQEKGELESKLSNYMAQSNKKINMDSIDKLLRVSSTYRVPVRYLASLIVNESIFSSKFSGSVEGLESFGGWYANMNAKGLTDCEKWKSLKPNDDQFCLGIENATNETGYFVGWE
jgi:hypothetical protein